VSTLHRLAAGIGAGIFAVLIGNEAIKWSVMTMETRAIPDAVASALLVLITAIFVAVTIDVLFNTHPVDDEEQK
jgi:hypothetical protein